MATDFIQVFGFLFLIIVILSFFTKLIKQPIIIGYVLSGILFSLLQTNTVDRDIIIIMSELGITFLLFLMGLEFDLKSLKYLGKDILISSLFQSLILFAIAFGLSSLFGFSWLERVYLSVLFLFSSTLLVANWLADKKETNTLHGKIILSTLIIQDLLAIVAIGILAVVQERTLLKIALVPAGALTLLVIAFILAKYLLNFILRMPARYPELLFISSLGICFLFVLIAPIFGYSGTIGAFIAGVTLANTIYKNDIIGRLKPLIIFFSMLFFVGLGFQIQLQWSLKLLLFVIVLSLLSLFLKPILYYLTFRQRHYGIKDSFIAGLHLAQLSEFGIIIIAGGVLTGAIGPELSSIAIVTVIATMVLSSYFIKYDKPLFRWIEPFLRQYDTKIFSTKVELEPVKMDCAILFFGYYDLGQEFYSKLQAGGKKILVIEQDPEHIEFLKKQNIPYLYNSVSDPEFFEHLNFGNVELMVSSLMDVEENKRIIAQLKHKNSNAIAIVTAKDLNDSLELYSHNADYVIYPSYLNEQQVSVLLEDYATDINKVLAKKINEITILKKKEEKKKTFSQEKSMLLDIDAFMGLLSGEKKRLKEAYLQEKKKLKKVYHKSRVPSNIDEVKEALKGITLLFEEEQPEKEEEISPGTERKI